MAFGGPATQPAGMRRAAQQADEIITSSKSRRSKRARTHSGTRFKLYSITVLVGISGNRQAAAFSVKHSANAES